jgi:hypothetical protein
MNTTSRIRTEVSQGATATKPVTEWERACANSADADNTERRTTPTKRPMTYQQDPTSACAVCTEAGMTPQRTMCAICDHLTPTQPELRRLCSLGVEAVTMDDGITVHRAWANPEFVMCMCDYTRLLPAEQFAHERETIDLRSLLLRKLSAQETDTIMEGAPNTGVQRRQSAVLDVRMRTWNANRQDFEDTYEDVDHHWNLAGSPEKEPWQGQF